MDPVTYDIVGWSIFVLCCILLGLFGADSRPGFSDGRTDVKERWFIQPKDDYRR